jgi:hypothetical protein
MMMIHVHFRQLKLQKRYCKQLTEPGSSGKYVFTRKRLVKVVQQVQKRYLIRLVPASVAFHKTPVIKSSMRTVEVGHFSTLLMTVKYCNSYPN